MTPEAMALLIEQIVKEHYTPVLIGQMVEKALSVVMLDVQEYVRLQLPDIVRRAVDQAWADEVSKQVRIQVQVQRGES